MTRPVDPRAGLVARVAEALRARAAGVAHRDPAWARRARALADRRESDALAWLGAWAEADSVGAARLRRERREYLGPARRIVAQARATGGVVSVDGGLHVEPPTAPGSRWLGEPGSVWGQGEEPGGAA